MRKQSWDLPAAPRSRVACKRKMPLRCAYKAYCVIAKEDGTLCADSTDGLNAVYNTARDAKASINRLGPGVLELSVARCYIVPAEMWEGA